jgi:hypothetical protein
MFPEKVLTCKNCEKVHTKDCPIRVWGRNEENELRVDSKVDIEKDYCSRMVVRIIPPKLGETDDLPRES